MTLSMNDHQLAAAIDQMQSMVQSALDSIAELPLNDHQVVAYDIAHGASVVAAARSLLPYASHGAPERTLATAFVPEAAHDLFTRIAGRADDWGSDATTLLSLHDLMTGGRSAAMLDSLADGTPSHLDADFELAADTFRRFANERLMPVAGEIHRTNSDVPESLITEMAALGVFGL